jgi:hypothetical protein
MRSEAETRYWGGFWYLYLKFGVKTLGTLGSEGSSSFESGIISALNVESRLFEGKVLLLSGFYEVESYN